MDISDFLVIGGGIIGISMARELKNNYPDSRIVVIEKEQACGLHTSGRNSGVLHAGFYYSPDSLKAKFTKEGNRSMTEYCLSKGIPVNRCGKLVVCRTEAEHPMLDELMRRGTVNGIQLESLSDKEAKEIEPRVKTCGRALYSPKTATVDPSKVVSALVADAAGRGIQVHSGVRYVRKQNSGVLTSGGVYQTGYVVNAAGLYSDRIALDYGFSGKYRILPFKGLYLYSEEPPGAVRTNVYPVPDLRNPFLGVHFTVTADGRTKIGPTAIPAFWREHYSGLHNFNLPEMVDIVSRELRLFAFTDKTLMKLAVEEMKKYSRSRMVSLASSLLDGVRVDSFRKWGRPGIRAQLLDIDTGKLEMDFVLQGDDRSMHILNAVSPAFTCALPFAQYVCREISKRLN